MAARTVVKGHFYLDGRLIGRRNWLFCNTRKGAAASASAYSIVCGGGRESQRDGSLQISEVPAEADASRRQAAFLWSLGSACAVESAGTENLQITAIHKQLQKCRLNGCF